MSNLTPIAPQCASDAPITLFLNKEHTSFHGISTRTVMTSTGETVFTVESKKGTLHKRRIVKDVSGTEIGRLRGRRMPGLHSAVYLGTMDDEKKCRVRTKGLLDVATDIYLRNDVVGEARGDARARSFAISVGGDGIAEIERESSGAPGTGNHSCRIAIAAGVDAAFVVMIACALDELYRHFSDL